MQSLLEVETRAVGRPQDSTTVMRALERIRETGFRTLNVDLMYGLPGQTPESWEASLRGVLAFEPEELYLYPLYARPKTGLERMNVPEEDRRLRLYREGRALLLERGYEQVSMRMFRRSCVPPDGEAHPYRPVYCCQEDGMVGLGCGARSYTRRLHYSTEYAVSPGAVRTLIRDYSTRSEDEFGGAHHGYIRPLAKVSRV
ncbi:MAG: hypothetical protein KY468_21460 [Armatimonadetes bacterium]|nr:hypothetical protein [Armatimonadota bacterium]